ncbi:hypothetical protein MTO96_024637 [Rhipicephalus appendiculatus]
MKGAPREKIVLEIPLSGRTYTAVAAPSGVHTVHPGHSGPYTKRQGFLAFFELCSHIKGGWTRERFGEEACSFLKLADQSFADQSKSVVSPTYDAIGSNDHKRGIVYPAYDVIVSSNSKR